MVRNSLAALVLLWLLVGCSGKSTSFNQPAEHWYNEMIGQIAMGNLDQAGDHHTSLIGEHPRSSLIGEATVMMALAHMDREEYLLANFYFDEYIRRFGTAAEQDRMQFFKLLSDYRGLARAGRDQQLILDSLERTGAFLEQQPDSLLVPYAATLQAQLLLGRSYMDGEIADLYDRLNKPDAATWYRERSRNDLKSQGEVIPPKSGFVRGLFE